jgi:hypothetical protein
MISGCLMGSLSAYLGKLGQCLPNWTFALLMNTLRDLMNVTSMSHKTSYNYKIMMEQFRKTILFTDSINK